MSELTDELWGRFGRIELDQLPDDVRIVAGHSILDWFGCAIAGSREPLSAILRDELSTDEGPCSLIGTDRRADPMRAAMINGATGHALDFDDTSTVMGGHPTVPMLPAVLAVAEAEGRSGADVLTAYVVGMEVQSHIGAAIGAEHYKKGFHTTSTFGVFGAAAAASWLLGADAEAFGHAMGIAASNAAGVKANFGTMTKPLHPGQAAERGVLAARLAARGYTANAAAIDGNQSFAQAAGSGGLDRDRFARIARGEWSTPLTLFKFHAACHLTHAGIEATSSILASGVERDSVEQITMTVHPSILDVCGIPDPVDGLQAKFSLRGTQALLVHGVDTAAVDSYSDGPIQRAEVQDFIPKVTVETDLSLTTMQTDIVLVADGVEHRASHDAASRSDDLDLQGAKLRSKFDALASPVIGADRAKALGTAVSDLASVTEVSSLMEAAR